LAIELAAARIQMLPPAAILQRLTSRLQLLTRGPRDLPQRQQTLRSTIDWSYSLLEDDEKALLARLGVFVGGWTVDAVEVIMKEDPAARIVMVTSVGHQEVVRRALGLGARYFLMKPLQFDEAVAALRFVLETPAEAGTSLPATGAEGTAHAG